MDGSFGLAISDQELPDFGGIDLNFKTEIDDFLRQNLTPEMRQAGRETTGLKSPPEAGRKWRAALLQKGWIAPSWPVEYGGAGWSTDQRLYFENACADNDAPILMSSGIRTIGPLIIAEGSPAQKARYLTAILSGEHEWCQGFSEPQAGSDLTALALRAERDGDSFILNGSKVWTSFAQYATHMFLLARCEPNSKRGAGLVFLLVKMDTPGITIRPIPFIDGEAETNEVFFDNVRIPVSDHIGDIGDGWATAKRLMAIARSNNTTTGVLRRAYRLALHCAREAGEMPAGLIARFADIRARIDTFEALEARAMSETLGLDTAAPSSALKVIATELHQQISELGIEAAPNSALALSKYFATRAATIYSGTSEVHRNILAKSL